MSNTISYSASFTAPSSPDPTLARPNVGTSAAANAVRALDATSTEAQPQPTTPVEQPAVRRDVERDTSGLTVFRTIDMTNGNLVAQFPTEAYLRLANAMKDAVREPVASQTPSARTV